MKNMFSKDGFYIAVIFLHLIHVYVIYCSVGFPKPQEIHNRQLGKFYWLYNKKFDYQGAEKICLENNQKVVQLPNLQEHLWVNKHVLDKPDCFWTGLKSKKFMDWQWEIMHGQIQNRPSRWNDSRNPLDPFKVKAYAVGPSLYSSNGNYSCRVVCQREYSTRQAKFSPVFGNQSLGGHLRTIEIPASAVQCASICLITANCVAFAVNRHEKKCVFFNDAISNHFINCEKEYVTCFKETVFFIFP